MAKVTEFAASVPPRLLVLMEWLIYPCNSSYEPELLPGPINAIRMFMNDASSKELQIPGLVYLEGYLDGAIPTHIGPCTIVLQKADSLLMCATTTEGVQYEFCAGPMSGYMGEIISGKYVARTALC